MSRGLRCLFLTAVTALAWLAAAPVAADQISGVDVTVGDRTVHALCTAGPRVVVLLHGEGASAESWRPVLQRLSGTVGACPYDRGEGGTASAGRGWFELMYELQSVHAALGVESPRGHAGGGHTRNAGGSAHQMGCAACQAERGRGQGDGPRPSCSGEPLARHSSVRDHGHDSEGQAARRVHASILRGVHSARHIPADGSGHEVHLEAPNLVAREISRMVRYTYSPEG